jgi:hypothetical protein
MRKLILFLTILFVMTTSEAVNDKWFKAEVKRIYPLSSGDFILIFKKDNSNCTNNSQYHRVEEGGNGVTRDGVKSMLSTALTAASTGREVTINFDADSAGCHINRLYVSF